MNPSRFDLIELKQIDGIEFMAEREVKEEPKDEPLAIDPDEDSFPTFGMNAIGYEESLDEKESMENEEPEENADIYQAIETALANPNILKSQIDTMREALKDALCREIPVDEIVKSRGLTDRSTKSDFRLLINKSRVYLRGIRILSCKNSTAVSREQHGQPLNPSLTKNGENIRALHVSSRPCGPTVTIDGITVPTGISRIHEGLKCGKISRSLAKPFHGTRDELRKKLTNMLSSLHCFRNIDALVEGIIQVGVDKVTYKQAVRVCNVQHTSLQRYLNAAKIFINFDESEITPERSDQNSREVSADNVSMEYLEPLPRPPEEKMNEEWEMKKEIKEEVKEEPTE